MSKASSERFTGVFSRMMQTANEDRTTLNEGLYRRMMIEAAMHRFKWVGMPDTIDLRFLEMTLFMQGLAVFFWSDDHDRYLALRSAGLGRINMYDNPTNFTVTGNMMMGNKVLGPDECVPIWSNYMRIPDWDIVDLYASRLAAIDKTFEQNIIQLRTPYIVSGPEEKKVSLMNALKDIVSGKPAIFTYDPMMADAIQTFNTNMSSTQPLDLLLMKQKTWNEAMTFLGINNANQDKKERLVADEVSANDSQVDLFRRTSLDTRQQAADQINRMFDLDVRVEWNEEVKSPNVGQPQGSLDRGNDSEDGGEDV